MGVWLGLGLVAGWAEVPAPELVALPYRVVHDEMLFLRDEGDTRYCVWTDDPAKATALLGSFAVDAPAFTQKKGEVLAVFVQDDIAQVLTGVMYNKATRLTVVVFTPPSLPRDIRIRGTARGGLSEKVP